MFHEYWFTEKELDVNPNRTTATQGDDALTIDVEIETDITIDSHLRIEGILNQECDVTIGPDRW